MSFQAHALPVAAFEALFALDDNALQARGACRMRVTVKPGFPCRVSLQDAEVGEEVILVNHEHLPGPSPYRARHAIFVRPGAVQARPAVNELPEILGQRLISVRAYDERWMMRSARVAEGEAYLRQAIEAGFSDPAVSLIHLHNAKPGCFACSVTRG